MSWRDFDPDAPRTLFPPTGERIENPLRQKPADGALVKPPKDRGQLRGAKWAIVVGTTLWDFQLAKANGIEGILFRSRKEAKRWISLVELERAGAIRKLERQVRYPLETIRRADGLVAVVAHYVADFIYEEKIEPNDPRTAWRFVVEDTKPSGFKMVRGKKKPFREEIYALKKRWFEAAYGITIRET